METINENLEGPWSVILAGGEGQKLKPFIQRWKGKHIPKQYCSFVGSRSMLQHTLDRADQISHPTKKITVIARSHQLEAIKHFSHNSGKVVIQPANRDTAVGIFFPLTHIRAIDPEATVVIFPSDHFICPVEPLFDAVRAAVNSVDHIPKVMVLLGVVPDTQEQDYGRIYPGPTLGIARGHHVRAIQAFLEKPNPVQIQKVITYGARWNTLILTAKVVTLWEIGKRIFPEMIDLFEKWQATIDTRHECSVLKEIYQLLYPQNFSTELLQKVPEHLAMIEMTNMIWSDWGHPDQIMESLQRIGKKPAFPLTILPEFSRKQYAPA